MATMTTPARAALPAGPNLDRLTQATLFHRDPLGFLSRMQLEYGDVFTLRMAVAGPMVIVADPALIDQVVELPREAGHAGEARRRIVQMVSERSVLGADEDVHRAARAALEPVFTPEAINRRRDAMSRIADQHVADWPRGRPFRVLPRMRAIADEIFARLVVGMRDDARARALAAATQRMLWSPGNPPVPPPGEGAGLAGELGKRLFERRKQPAARLLADEIDARRSSASASDGDGDGGIDVIAALLAAEPAAETGAIVDALLPLLMAGQEPAAAGLTWILDRLGRAPELRDRFMDAPEDDAVRTAIVAESLRLRPAVHSVARRLTEARRIGDHTLPAGVVATVPIVLVHRDPVAFPDPDEFRPERFIGHDPDELPYLPFGGGERRCLGQWLAHAEIGTVLPSILSRVDVRPTSREPERMVVRGTVTVPVRSCLATARDR